MPVPRDNLHDYDAKRDFTATPEPRGGRAGTRTKTRTKARDADGVQRFVVQEHHARALHWDLRLEHEGTLASWAVPKGIPVDPGENHLAVRTEDHPMEYLDFHGDIPRGQYGAGTMTVWDRGDYETFEWEPGKVVVRFSGERVQGRYALFRTKGKNWMIHRMDPPQDPGRVDPPADFRPMLATTAKRRPTGDSWAFEMKWAGERATALVQGGRVHLLSADGDDLIARFPELRGLGAQLGATEALLDGVITTLGADGRPDADVLAGRVATTDSRRAARLARAQPVVFMIFDVVWLDGRMVGALAYEERRSVLERIGLGGPAWQTPPAERGDGARAVEAARQLGFAAVVAKRLDAPYEPGTRSRAWLEVAVPARTTPGPSTPRRSR
jgi:bifunctional non-homologous end joining protein LigD